MCILNLNSIHHKLKYTYPYKTIITLIKLSLPLIVLSCFFLIDMNDLSILPSTFNLEDKKDIFFQMLTPKNFNSLYSYYVLVLKVINHS